MASGHMNRVKRPDTWLHRPMLQNVKKVLANPEPSTHDPELTSTAKEVGQINALHINSGQYITADARWHS